MTTERDEWERTVDKQLIHLEVMNAVQEEREKTIIKKLDKIDANQTWLFRVVAGAIILAFVSWVIAGGLIIP